MLEIDLDFPNDTIYYDITVKGDVTVKRHGMQEAVDSRKKRRYLD